MSDDDLEVLRKLSAQLARILAKTPLDGRALKVTISHIADYEEA